MRTSVDRRHVVLFLLALVLPCLVLIALGVRTISVGEELETSRKTADERRRLNQVEAELSDALERTILDEAGALAGRPVSGRLPRPKHAELALVAWVREGRVELPWESGPDAARFRAILRDSRFATAIADGERLEHGTLQFEPAFKAYERARALAGTPAETDYANLLRARTLVKAGRIADAKLAFAGLLASATTDDEGIPIAFYAADRLVGLHANATGLPDAVGRPVDGRDWLSPPAASFARRLIMSLVESNAVAADRQRLETLRATVDTLFLDMERARRLQRDFATLRFPAGNPSTRRTWVAFDDSAWLVTSAPSLAGLPPLVVAARSAVVFAAVGAAPPADSSLTQSTIRFSMDPADGQAVGDAFPGLRVAIASDSGTAAARQWLGQRAFYIAALCFIIGVSVVGGVLFWRSVRRELQLAELRSQFVASVSHELRTPLTAIRMFAETLRMDRPLTPSARVEYLDTIVQESERLTRLVNNVLDFSRIERGEKQYRLEPASVAAIVRTTAGTVEYPLARNGFQLRLDLADDLPHVRVDEDAIGQAVLNLLSNAMKYAGETRQIDLSVQRLNGDAVIAVTDYGLGIAPDEWSRIFERYYRAPVPENGRIPGAGLGLALVDHIVKAHGGHVQVTSTPGAGSTFAIHLPLEAQS